MNRYILCWMAIGYSLGIGVSEWFPVPVISVVMGAALLAGLVLAWKNMKWRTLLLILLFALLGGTRMQMAVSYSGNDVMRYVGHEIHFSGVVSEVPVIHPLDEEQIRATYIVEVEQVMVFGQKKSASSGRMLLNVRQSRREAIARYGDRISGKGTLYEIHGYNNPGTADYSFPMKKRGISVRMGVPIAKIQMEGSKGIYGELWEKIRLWRENLHNSMKRSMPEADASVLLGMLFGGYEGIRGDVLEEFSAIGLVHILSVSGSHVALVAMVVFWICCRLGLSKKTTMIFSIVSIGGYALLSGCTPPVLRSAFMGCIALVAMYTERKYLPINGLGAAGLVLLMGQPGLLYDVSFQLSFASAAGVVMLYTPNQALLSKLPEWASASIALTMSAQIGVLPLQVWYYHMIPVISFVSNIIVLPLAEAAIVLGLVGVIVQTLSAVGGGFIFVGCSLLVGAMHHMSSLLSSFPGGVIYLPACGILGGFIYYILVLVFYGILSWSGSFFCRERDKERRIIACVTAIMLMTGYCVIQEVQKSNEVHFIDVGQGDAVLIVTRKGKAVLIDCGNKGEAEGAFDVGKRVVLPYIRAQGIRELEGVILTHGHSDHAGGASAIVQSMPVKCVFFPEGEITASIQNLWRQYRLGTVAPLLPEQRMTIDEVAFRVVHVEASSGTGENRSGRNDGSAVIQVTIDGYIFLITGDLTIKGETSICDQGKSVKSHVLKVGHHGAKTSTSERFLSAVLPDIAVISAGYGNPYGHPHNETLQRLDRLGVQVFRTDRHGAVVFVVGKDGIKIRN